SHLHLQSNHVQSLNRNIRTGDKVQVQRTNTFKPLSLGTNTSNHSTQARSIWSVPSQVFSLAKALRDFFLLKDLDIDSGFEVDSNLNMDFEEWRSDGQESKTKKCGGEGGEIHGLE